MSKEDSALFRVFLWLLLPRIKRVYMRNITPYTVLVEAAAEPVEAAVLTERIVKQVASTGSATEC
jgi:hypothetical protein